MLALANISCPIPSGHTPQSALATFNKVRKQMPGLTPASWRKAAAQELGLDYDTYLSLWKEGNSAKKAAKLVQASTPTVEAAASVSADMGFAPSAAKSAIKPKSPLPTGTGQSTEDALTALKKQKAQKDVDEVVTAALDDVIDEDAIGESFQYMLKNKADYGLTEAEMLKLFQQANNVIDASKATKAALQANSALPTAYGPLTHNLAKDAYKVVKAGMPGATPAQIRHAAADYLEVSYNDYLKAWNKPTNAAQQAAQTTAIKLPPIQPVPLTPTTAGKYAGKDIDVNVLKDELARLYGPEANKAYINLTYNDATGAWTTQFPSSILKTQAAKDQVAQGLKDLGLKVTKSGSNYKIESSKGAQVAANNAAQIKQTGTYTLPNGQVVLDLATADAGTTSWWNTLTEPTKAAWKNYTSSGYRKINGDLRAGRYGSDDVAFKISQSMPKIETPITVFRGNGSHFSIREFKVGKNYNDKGFMSSAINPGSAWSGVRFEITMPKGSRGQYIGKKSSHPSENEFLIDKNTEFRVVEVDAVNNIVRMVAIPH